MTQQACHLNLWYCTHDLLKLWFYSWWRNANDLTFSVNCEHFKARLLQSTPAIVVSIFFVTGGKVSWFESSMKQLRSWYIFFFIAHDIFSSHWNIFWYFKWSNIDGRSFDNQTMLWKITKENNFLLNIFKDENIWL